VIPALALLRRFWWAPVIGGLIIAMLVGALRLQAVEGERDEARATVAAQAAQIATLKTDAGAKEQASIERATDAEKDTATQKETSNALRTAADPRRALSCLRLKRAGATPLPAICRS